MFLFLPKPDCPGLPAAGGSRARPRGSAAPGGRAGVWAPGMQKCVPDDPTSTPPSRGCRRPLGRPVQGPLRDCPAAQKVPKTPPPGATPRPPRERRWGAGGAAGSRWAPGTGGVFTGAPPSAGTHTERRKLPGFVRGTQFTAVTPEGLPQTACDLTQLTSFSVRVWGRGGNSSVSGNLIGILAVYSFGNSKPEPVLGDLCKPAPRDQGRLVCRHQDRASGPAAAASPAGQSRGGEGAGAGGPLPRPRARALGGGL